MRSTLLTLGVLLAAAAVLAPGAAQAKTRSCGTLDVYDARLPLTATGLTCRAARSIARGCDPDGKTWSCVATTPLKVRSVLIWFRSQQRFAKTWTQRVTVRRAPCSASRFSASEWRVAPSGGFEPGLTRHQLIADDLVRCGRLKGRTTAQVRRMLGAPTETLRDELSYAIGTERGTLFAMDGEYLDLQFRDGRVRRASIAAG